MHFFYHLPPWLGLVSTINWDDVGPWATEFVAPSNIKLSLAIEVNPAPSKCSYPCESLQTSSIIYVCAEIHHHQSHERLKNSPWKHKHRHASAIQMSWVSHNNTSQVLLTSPICLYPSYPNFSMLLTSTPYHFFQIWPYGFIIKLKSPFCACDHCHSTGITP